MFVLPENLDVDAIGNSVRKLGAGLDIRASGGQIVVAPSFHRSGRRYRWSVRVAMVQLPSWIYELLAEPAHEFRNSLPRVRPDAERLRRYGEAALEHGSLSIANAAKGERNATLFREAVSLAELVGAEVLPQERVWHELTRAARSAGLGSFETRTTLASAFRRGLPRPRWPR